MESAAKTIKPSQIFSVAKAKAAENIFFKKYLKQFPSTQIDPMVHQLYAEFTAKIDCTTCANCCSYLEPGIDEAEIERLAACQQMDPVDFKRAHVAFDGEALFLKAKPCMFLQEKKCGIYIDRPQACAAYPHLEQENFKYKRNVWSNYQICPIVFEVIEKLKNTLGFKYEKKGM